MITVVAGFALAFALAFAMGKVMDVLAPANPEETALFELLREEGYTGRELAKRMFIAKHYERLTSDPKYGFIK